MLFLITMNKSIKTLLWLAGFILLIVGLWMVRTVIIYVLIAAVLSLIARPIVKFIEKIKIGKKNIPSSISALLTLVVIIGCFFGLVYVFYPLVYEQSHIIANIDYVEFSKGMEEPLSDLGAWASEYGLIPQETTPEQYFQDELWGVIRQVELSSIINAVVAQLGNIFIAIFSIFFITFFFLKDRYLLFKLIFSVAAEKSHEKLKNVIRESKETLTRYFIGLIIQVTLVATLVSIGLTILGVEYAISIGIFAGFINLVPYIGPILAGLFGMLVTIISNLEMDFYSETLPLALQVFLVFSIIQLLDNFIFQPFIFSNSVNAHPLEIFIVILCAGVLMGITGMIVAVPLYSFIRIIAKAYFSQFRIVQSITKKLD